MIKFKYLLLLSIILCGGFVSAVNVDDYTQEYTTDENTMALYHFSNGAITTDSSGNSHTLTNATADSVAGGKFGYGADFELADLDQAIVTDHADFEKQTFTLEAWFKFESLPASTHQRLMSYSPRNYSNGAGYLTTIYNFGDGNYLLRSTASESGTTHYYDANVVLNTADWFHLAFTFESGSQKIYLNGTQVGSTGTDTFTINYADGGSGYPTPAEFAIGSITDPNTDAKVYPFDGIMDEVRFSKVVRSFIGANTPTVTITAPALDDALYYADGTFTIEWNIADADTPSDVDLTIHYSDNAGEQDIEILALADADTYCTGTYDDADCTYTWTIPDVGTYSGEAYIDIEVFDNDNVDDGIGSSDVFDLNVFPPVPAWDYTEEYTTDGDTVALYHFSNGSFTTDSSGNSLTLTNNGADNVSGGKFDYAGDWESTGTTELDTMEVHNALVGIDGEFTIEAWVKPESESDTSEYIIRNNNNYKLFWQIATEKLWCSFTTSGFLYYVDSDGEFNSDTDDWIGEWNHLACVMDEEDMTLTLYRDGQIIGQNDVVRLPESQGSGLNELGIGNSAYGDNTYFYRKSGWDGLIDEVRISDVSRVAVLESTLEITEPDTPLEVGETFIIYADFEDENGANITGGDALCIFDAGDGDGDRYFSYDAGSSAYKYTLTDGYDMFGEYDYSVTCTKSTYEEQYDTGTLEVALSESDVDVECISNCTYALTGAGIDVTPTTEASPLIFSIENLADFDFTDFEAGILNSLNDKDNYYVDTSVSGSVWTHSVSLTKAIQRVWDDDESKWSYRLIDTIPIGDKTYYTLTLNEPAYTLTDTSFSASSEWSVVEGLETWNTTNEDCGYGCSELIGSGISDVAVVSNNHTIQGGTTLKFTAWADIDVNGTVTVLYQSDLEDAEYSDTFSLTTSPTTFYFQNTQNQEPDGTDAENMIWEITFDDIDTMTSIYIDEVNEYQPQYFTAPLQFLKLNKNPLDVWIEVDEESYVRIMEVQPFLVYTQIADPNSDIDSDSADITLSHDADDVITSIYETSYQLEDGDNYMRINGVIDYNSTSETVPHRLMKVTATVNDNMGVGYQETAWVVLEQYPFALATGEWALRSSEYNTAKNQFAYGRAWGYAKVPEALSYLELVVCDDAIDTNSLTNPTNCETNGDDLYHKNYYPVTDFTMNSAGEFDFFYESSGAESPFKFYTDGNYTVFIKAIFKTEAYNGTYSADSFSVGDYGASCYANLINGTDDDPIQVSSNQNLRFETYYLADDWADLTLWTNAYMEIQDENYVAISRDYYPNSWDYRDTNGRNYFYYDEMIWDNDGDSLSDGNNYYANFFFEDLTYGREDVNCTVNFDVNITVNNNVNVTDLGMTGLTISKGNTDSFTTHSWLRGSPTTINRMELVLYTNESGFDVTKTDQENQIVTLSIPFEEIVKQEGATTCTERSLILQWLADREKFGTPMGDAIGVCISDATKTAIDDAEVNWVTWVPYASLRLRCEDSDYPTLYTVHPDLMMADANALSYFDDTSIATSCVDMHIEINELNPYLYAQVLNDEDLTSEDTTANSMLDYMLTNDIELYRDDIKIRLWDKEYTLKNNLVVNAQQQGNDWVDDLYIRYKIYYNEPQDVKVYDQRFLLISNTKGDSGIELWLGNFQKWLRDNAPSYLLLIFLAVGGFIAYVYWRNAGRKGV